MNNNIVFGQYVEKDSVIHRLDPRTKLVSLLLLMISVFLIPSPIGLDNKWLPFIAIGVFFLLDLVIISLSKISIISYFRSIRQVFFIIVLAFMLQIFTKSQDALSYDFDLHFSVLGIIIDALVLLLFFVTLKQNKAKIITFLLILVFGIYILTINFDVLPVLGDATLKIYQTGLFNGAFFSTRIFIVITFSTSFSLTTKPTDISKALEWLLHPLTIFKINISVFAMMISLALRFIPTLFNEANKILKAQASRGVDFNEGSLKDKVSQIVSLIIPMFVISYKKADDLALAMEARGYIPENERTSIVELKFKAKDYVSFFIILLFFVLSLLWRILF